MRVMITGGTGLIGHQLVMNLAKDGHEVIILSRNPKQKGPMPQSVSFQEYDANTTEGWGHRVNEVDAIVNLAGENIAGNGFLPTRWTDERKKKILQSRVDVGKAITAAIEAATDKPKVLIQSSAVGYYGTHPMETEITEESSAGDDFLASVCKQWETSTAPVKEMGVRRAIIRTGIVLDKDEGTLPRLSLPFKIGVGSFGFGGPLGDGKQPMPWIHIDDEIRAIRFLLEHGDAEGPFNLVAPGVVDNTAFARSVGKALGRTSFIPAPGFAFKAAFGELSTLLLDGQKALPARLLELGFEFKYPEVQEALNAIYKPQTLATAS